MTSTSAFQLEGVGESDFHTRTLLHTYLRVHVYPSKYVGALKGLENTFNLCTNYRNKYGKMFAFYAAVIYDKRRRYYLDKGCARTPFTYFLKSCKNHRFRRPFWLLAVNLIALRTLNLSFTRWILSTVSFSPIADCAYSQESYVLSLLPFSLTVVNIFLAFCCLLRRKTKEEEPMEA